MTEQKTNRTEEQLEQGAAQEQRRQTEWKNSLDAGSGDCCGRHHPGCNLVLVVIGGVILGLGQMVQGKSKEQSDRQAFDAIAPDIVGTVFENVQMNPDLPSWTQTTPTFPCPTTPVAAAVGISAEHIAA